MRSTNRRALASFSLTLLVLAGLVGGCGTRGTASQGESALQFSMGGSRAKTYIDLKGLAKDSSNIVIAESAGMTRKEQLPDFAKNPNVDSPPNIMVTVSVTEVLAGEDITKNSNVEVVAFGEDTEGVAALAKSGRYLLFLAPYIFVEPDRPPVPVSAQSGGIVYAIVGGPAGMYYQPIESNDRRYIKTDSESSKLPNSVLADDVHLTPGWTDDQYVITGGPWGHR